MTERLVTGDEKIEDKEFEWSLRPRRLQEFIGQEGVKANLEILITAARGRNEPCTCGNGRKWKQCHSAG